MAKPIWLTEIGCPAVDKGGNQPNLFPDPKSSESGYPYASTRRRDDLLQHRFLEAALTRFDPLAVGHPAGANPAAPSTGLRMVEPDRSAVWAYDMRPFPAFPALSSVWGDAANWSTGHWLNGRLEGAPLDRLIAAIANDFGLAAPACGDLEGFVDGYIIERPMSARAALEPLIGLFGVSVRAEADRLGFYPSSGVPVRSFLRDDLAEDGSGPLLVLRRDEEGELPRSIGVSYSDGARSYRPTSASAGLVTPSDRSALVDLPAVLSGAEARRATQAALAARWTGRESAIFRLPPAETALEPGDVITLSVEGVARLWRIERIADADTRLIEARAVAAAIEEPADPPKPTQRKPICPPPRRLPKP